MLCYDNDDLVRRDYSLPIASFANNPDFKIINTAGRWNRMRSPNRGRVFVCLSNTWKDMHISSKRYRSLSPSKVVSIIE